LQHAPLAQLDDQQRLGRLDALGERAGLEDASARARSRFSRAAFSLVSRQVPIDSRFTSLMKGLLFADLPDLESGGDDEIASDNLSAVQSIYFANQLESMVGRAPTGARANDGRVTAWISPGATLGLKK
jgi:hypothetical protein